MRRDDLQIIFPFGIMLNDNVAVSNFHTVYYLLVGHLELAKLLKRVA